MIVACGALDPSRHSADDPDDNLAPRPPDSRRGSHGGRNARAGNGECDHARRWPGAAAARPVRRQRRPHGELVVLVVGLEPQVDRRRAQGHRVAGHGPHRIMPPWSELQPNSTYVRSEQLDRIPRCARHRPAHHPRPGVTPTLRGSRPGTGFHRAGRGTRRLVPAMPSRSSSSAAGDIGRANR